MVSYLISRQTANDIRTNIAREIDIIAKLRSGSPEAVKLEGHVSSSVDELLMRDRRRRQNGELWWSFAPLPAALLLIAGMRAWRTHGVPVELRALVEGAYWGLLLVTVTLGVRFLWEAAIYSYLVAALGIKYVRLGWLKLHTAVLRWRLRQTEADFLEMREWGSRTSVELHDRKEELIDRLGQQWWDATVGRVEEMVAKGDAVEKDQLDRSAMRLAVRQKRQAE